MALDDLKETIETLRERIQTHRTYLEGNETRTRQVLIDPMLRALGWDVEDPHSVELEHKIEKKKKRTNDKLHWIDYTLMGSEKSIALIEAKVIGTPLDEEATGQALNYANMKGIPYMVVTDGDHWQMFKVFEEVQLEERIRMDFQLTREEPYACALQALGLWRPNLASGEPPREATPPVLVKPSHDKPEPATPEQSSTSPGSEQEAVESSNNGDWIPLTSLKVEKGQKPPAYIQFPNSSPETIKNWIDLLETIAKHLVKTDKLSVRDCPVPVASKGKAKRYLVHTEPIPPNRKIGNELWLFTNFSSTDAYKNACWLLERFGDDVSPSTVLVSTNPG